MKIKYTFILYLLCVSILVILGMKNKKDYRDFNDDNKSLNKFIVGIMPDELIDIAIKVLKKGEKTCNNIVVVECLEKTKFSYGCTTQKIRINRVIKGDLVEKEEIIDIVFADEIYMNSSEDTPEINMGFVNEMKVGKNYLIFLDERIKNSNMYSLKQSLIKPIFAYENIENKPCISTMKVESATLYGNMSSNEFFVESERGLEKIEIYKKSLLEKYPYN
ncbi:hypothetical protein SAMN02745111_02209 [Eubacterium uniforme]|uniref:Uncharacterized protein n=1 Tax=Eubacterium uniforme TaxID=39495 RepID=A0A1T4W2K3_9FIRM|nr:hypothetical protein [Eubacterium uniforme]SKA71379.1 hypothetical protein SAMN02745111_02209 [Eubacterium uniforme]